MKRHTPEKRLKTAILQAFEDVAKPADFNPPDRKTCVWMRSNLIMMSEADIHCLLPYIMIDSIEHLNEPEFDSRPVKNNRSTNGTAKRQARL